MVACPSRPLRVETAEDPSEEGGAGGQDDLVGAHPVRPIVAAQGDVEKLFVLAQFSKTGADVGLEVIPPVDENPG